MKHPNIIFDITVKFVLLELYRSVLHSVKSETGILCFPHGSFRGWYELSLYVVRDIKGHTETCKVP